MVLANNCNFFMPLLRNSIMTTYGHPRMEQEEYNRRYEAGQLTQQQIDDQDCPGPFSFFAYLKVLLTDGFGGMKLYSLSSL